MNTDKIELRISDDDSHVAYLKLPKHPTKIESGTVKKTISMLDIMPDYKGIPLYFDFDKDNELIGIEIVG